MPLDPITTLRGQTLLSALPKTRFPEIEKPASSTNERLLRDSEETGKQIAALKRIEDDLIPGSGQALRQGGAAKFPGDKKVAVLNEEIVAAHRRLQGLDVALEECRRELFATIEKHRGRWLKEMGKAIEGKRREYEQAVEKLGELKEALDAERTFARWLEDFPSQPRRVTGGLSLKTEGGSQYGFPQVLDALRESARLASEQTAAASGERERVWR